MSFARRLRLSRCAATWGLRAARRRPLVPIVAASTMALALLVGGVFALVAANLTRMTATWRSANQATVYLESGVSAARARQLAQTLARMAGVEAAQVVEPREAYQRLKRSLGDRADLLDSVDEDLLPTSIEVRLGPGVPGVLRAHPVFDRLRHVEGVEAVDLAGSWAERLGRAQQLVASATVVLGLLVAAACLYIVASTIRLGVFARRDEIEILTLLGATHRLVKAPFLIEGVMEGLLGAGVACALLYALYLGAVPRVEHALAGMLAASPLRFFHPAELAAGFGLGALLGLAGSALALGRHVRI